jgi:uncharacterized protein (DUF433 family)
MQNERIDISNPIRDLISDDVFVLLNDYNLLSEKAIRDHVIRKKFKELRKSLSAGDAIDQIREEYPYLQFDTVRKIVYAISR